MASHQVNLLDLADGVITRHDAWYGGRWEASLQVDIEAGLQVAREES